MARRLLALRGFSARCSSLRGSLVPALDADVTLASLGPQTPGTVVQATHITTLAASASAVPVDASWGGEHAIQRGSLLQESMLGRQPAWGTPSQLMFNDAHAAFVNHSSAAMLRSMSVSLLCTVKPLVDNADAVLASLKAVCGNKLINAAVRRTLFAHFCAGETAEETRRLAQRLRGNGVGSIFAYSVESDVGDAAATGVEEEAAEAGRDEHLEKLVESIWAARTKDSRGFAAVKVTALGQPQMLEAVSAALAAGRPPCELPDRQLALMDAALCRLTHLARAASKAGVRLLIDAEQSYLQPAIDLFAIELQRQFNSQQPVVYNTYQAYRSDTHPRLLADTARTDAEGWHFGAKLVRGAYLVLERQRAAQLGYESPIHETKAATDASYDRCVGTMLRKVAAGSGAEVVVAGHNQHSIQTAAAAMQQLGLSPDQPGIRFAQLMGMCDCATYTLANHGYQVLKYLPYGPLNETLPYLIRRAQENSDIMGGVGQEVRLLRGELWRRATAPLPARTLAAGSSARKPASALAV